MQGGSYWSHRCLFLYQVVQVESPLCYFYSQPSRENPSTTGGAALVLSWCTGGRKACKTVTHLKLGINTC